MASKKRRRPSLVIKGRLACYRAAMAKRRIRALLITKRADLFYLSGFTGEDSAGLITPTQFHLLSDRRFEESIRQECPWARVWMRKKLLNDEIAKVCRALKIRSLAVQADSLTLADQTELGKLMPTLRLKAAPPITGEMRRLKDRSELSALSRAMRVAEEAFVATRKSIRIGQTESAIAARLEYEMKMRGASGPSFPTICAEGRNAALPHAHPDKRKVKEGSAILLDWGARVDNYCSDLTRMLFVGSVPPKLAKIYAIVLDAQQRGIRAIKPGARMCDIDKIARGAIKKSGYGKEFNHGLGHGLGLDVHEPPSLSWRSEEPCVEGMVVTVEPGIYLPGVGGVRIEDDVLVTRTGRKVLSRLSTRLEDAII